MDTWKPDDDRIIRIYADSGLGALSFMLAKRPSDILRRSRELGVIVSEPEWENGTDGAWSSLSDIDDMTMLNLSGSAHLCPRCGSGLILPWTTAGRKFGICPTCHYRALRDAAQDKTKELKARKEYRNSLVAAERMEKKATI